MKKIRQYIFSPSTITAGIVVFVMYCSYAYVHSAWMSPALILICSFVAVFLPIYSRMSNRIEEKANFITAFVTAGRISRFCVQFLFNLSFFQPFFGERF